MFKGNKDLDTDGYPTEEALRYVREYDVSKRPIKVLVEFIKSIWWAEEWGFKIRDRTDDMKMIDNLATKPYKHKYKVLELHCGGWSGNENIIKALSANKWFYCFYWVQSTRGGHYLFEIPLKTWETGSIKNG